MRNLKENKVTCLQVYCGPGSVVGIATGYGLDGPGIEFRWRRDFSHLSRPALGPTQLPVKWVPVLSRGYRADETWRWPLAPLQCRGQERVELYLYSPYGPYGLYNGVLCLTISTGLLLLVIYRFGNSITTSASCKYLHLKFMSTRQSGATGFEKQWGYI